MPNLILLSKKQLIAQLWSAAPQIKQLLIAARTITEARDHFFDLLNDLERQYYNIFSTQRLTAYHIIERDNAKECIRVLKNVIRTENEKLTDFSALQVLHDLAQDKISAKNIKEGFLVELLFLFRGAYSHSDIVSRYYKKLHHALASNPFLRTKQLDLYSNSLDRHFNKFVHGRMPEIRKKNLAMTQDILKYFNAPANAWADYRWHLQHVVRDLHTLSGLIKLEKDETEGLRLAEENNIHFQITPYYLSLFNKKGRTSYDRGIRAQVLPSVAYCRAIIANRSHGVDMDFMGEKTTSPITGITRRYPQIVILKPYDSCPQICVYCQRNWEITDMAKATTSRNVVQRALAWIKKNKAIHEVLITGGDPLTLNNTYLDWLLGELAAFKHIERIRIGTRVLVTVPFRIDSSFYQILKKYHQIGNREIALMTHIEYGTEITDDFVAAVARIKNAGVSVYNQQVFTYYNSRRFETSCLRKMLKLCGVDPYYTFNTKGKNETIDYRVPIARLEQEYKEEARLLPGLVRTDEPVFNVPRQGKSSLVAWQDHEPIMILADGSRVYRFYPWESRFSFADDYLYTDVPIYDYLKRLNQDGENINEYASIWYYF